MGTFWEKEKRLKNNKEKVNKDAFIFTLLLIIKSIFAGFNKIMTKKKIQYFVEN